MFGEQQYHVVWIPQISWGSDWGLGQWASWPLHGSVHGSVLGWCMGDEGEEGIGGVWNRISLEFDTR